MPQAMGDAGRNYESATISVRLEEEKPGVTSMYLSERGDADWAIVHAFYWTTIQILGSETRLLRHREATTPLMQGAIVATELPMPIADIVFMRVKEMKLLNQSEFGDVPKR